MTPTVSVIVIVYNGEKTLPLCLNSLMNLDYPKGELEIIVVDNASSDRTPQIIKGYPVKYVLEPCRGCARARNAGIRCSRGQFIAFLDADCVADKLWLREIVRPLENCRIGAAGGKILPLGTKNIIERFVYREGTFYCQCGESENARNILPWIVAANSIFRKEAIEKTGLFDEKFFAYEDMDITVGMVLKGYNIAYAPDAVVFHRHPGNLLNLCKSLFKRGRFFSYILIKYKYMIRIGAIRYLLRDLMASAFSITEEPPPLKGGIEKLDSQYSAIFVLLDIFKNIFFSLGYLYGCIESSAKRVYRRTPADGGSRILYWNEGDDLAILDLSKAPPGRYSLGGSAKRMWELLLEKRDDINSIAEIMADEYDVEIDLVKDDLQDFELQLKEAGILHNKTLSSI